MSQTANRSALRVTGAGGVALSLVLLALSAPAHAVRPPNDVAKRAIEITAVPGTIQADTRSATRDRVERECVGARSVWYRYTPATTGRVKMTTIGSSYDTVLAVYQGAKSPHALVACSDDAADVASAAQPVLTAGRRYWIAVSSWGRRGRSGDLVLRFYTGGTPKIVVTLDGAEAGAVSGRVRVHGTVSCDTPSVVYAELQVSQAVGEHVARGWSGFQELECLAVPTDWLVRIDSDTGWAFQPGTLALDLYGVGYDGFSRVRTNVEANLAVAIDPQGKRRR